MDKNETQTQVSVTKKQQTAILITMILVNFTVTFNASSVNLAIPGISADFNSKATLTGWIVTSYILVTAMLALPFGRIADFIGKRRIFISGLATFTAISFLTVFSPNIEIMILLRILVGISGAMIFATNMAILVNSFPREKSGRVLGLCVMFTYIGLTLGPVVGGILTHNFGWHSIFIFTAIFSVIPLVSAIIGIPKKSLDNKSFKEISLKEINPVGILLYGSMIFAIMLGFTEIAETYYSWGIMVIGFILLFVFIKHEQKTSRPILELRLFRKNPQFVFSNLASFLNYGATFAVSYLLSVYFQIVLDFDAQIAGIILIIQPAIQALLSPIAGRLSDKYPPYIIATTGMAMCAIGLFSYIFVDHNSSPIHYTINLVVVGIGFGLFSSPNSHAIMSSIPPKDSSVASSMIATMRTLGHATSMAIITLIVGANLGNRTFAEASVAELEVTMRIAFIVFTCVCVLGIFCSLQRKRK